MGVRVHGRCVPSPVDATVMFHKDPFDIFVQQLDRLVGDEVGSEAVARALPPVLLHPLPHKRSSGLLQVHKQYDFGRAGSTVPGGA